MARIFGRRRRIRREGGQTKIKCMIQAEAEAAAEGGGIRLTLPETSVMLPKACAEELARALIALSGERAQWTFGILAAADLPDGVEFRVLDRAAARLPEADVRAMAQALRLRVSESYGAVRVSRVKAAKYDGWMQVRLTEDDGTEAASIEIPPETADSLAAWLEGRGGWRHGDMDMQQMRAHGLRNSERRAGAPGAVPDGQKAGLGAGRVMLWSCVRCPGRACRIRTRETMRPMWCPLGTFPAWKYWGEE